MKIEVEKQYMNRTAGICGSFDGNSNNDRMGPDGLYKTTLSELAESWNEEKGDCKANTGEPNSKCEEVRRVFCTMYRF